jgi:predicted dehydrogenase
VTVRTALIGCGVLAPIHPRAAERPGGGIAYIGAFDTDPTGAAGIAERFGLPRTYPSWSAMLADPGVDAVDLCLPHHPRHPLALEALTAGKHALVEKPLAPTTALYAEMVEKAARAGCVLMPVHNRSSL